MFLLPHFSLDCLDHHLIVLNSFSLYVHSYDLIRGSNKLGCDLT